MQKDFKIGLILGVIIAIAVVIWLCTLPKLSAISRAMQSTSEKTAQVEPPPQNSQPAAQPTAPVEPPAPKIDSPVPTMNNQQSTINNNQLSFINHQFYIVQKGDTLSKISQKYYGSTRSWQKILSANQDVLPDPNHLKPGLKLIIPE